VCTATGEDCHVTSHVTSNHHHPTLNLLCTSNCPSKWHPVCPPAYRISGPASWPLLLREQLPCAERIYPTQNRSAFVSKGWDVKIHIILQNLTNETEELHRDLERYHEDDWDVKRHHLSSHKDKVIGLAEALVFALDPFNGKKQSREAQTATSSESHKSTQTTPSNQHISTQTSLKQPIQPKTPLPRLPPLSQQTCLLHLRQLPKPKHPIHLLASNTRCHLNHPCKTQPTASRIVSRRSRKNNAEFTREINIPLGEPLPVQGSRTEANRYYEEYL
jgi:hypothetical protein